MTPKEKAKELVDKFYPLADGMNGRGRFYYEICFKNQKKSALIVVDEILEVLNQLTLEYEYWQEVKTEIEKL